LRTVRTIQKYGSVGLIFFLLFFGNISKEVSQFFEAIASRRKKEKEDFRALIFGVLVTLFHKHL